MIAYFDCFSGASGDMILGAAIDAGVPLEVLRQSLAALELRGYELHAEKVIKQGFAATRATVRLEQDADAKHRHLSHITEIIGPSKLSNGVKDRSLRIFTRLAEAEAAAHGSTIEKVHFHEVGAIDAIVDVVGACLALEHLGADRIVCSPIPTGHGTVTCDHGTMPIPAPGTAALLTGVPLAECDEPGELTTPTGAAILTTLADTYGPLPAMIPTAIGYGAGQRDGIHRPNLLRLIIGTPAESAPTERIEVLEANLDDCTPEMIGYTLERLMLAGALDAYAVPIMMKKSRPATLLTVLCDPARRSELETIIFEETTTLGIRRHRTERSMLPREWTSVDTRFGSIRIKIGSRDGRVITASPEYDDCREAAAKHKASLRTVMTAAMNVWNRSQEAQ